MTYQPVNYLRFERFYGSIPKYQNGKNGTLSLSPSVRKKLKIIFVFMKKGENQGDEMI